MLGEEPSLGEGVGAARLNKYNLGPSPGSRIPQHAFYVAGKFMQLLSVYAAYHYLVTTEAPVVPFVFFCLLLSSIIFLIAQRPWKGRPLSSAQWLPTVINGGIMALQLVLWAYGLRTCGPIRTIMAEYSGAVVGAFSIVLFGRRGHRWAKLRGLLTMLAAFYLLSQGWAMDSAFPFSRHFRPSKEEGLAEEKGHVGLGSMTLPVMAGLVGALRRLLARRVGMKTQSKRRLHSVTVASAAAFMFPVAVFHLTASAPAEPMMYEGSALKVYLLTIIFNIVLGFYGDTFAEEKLQLGPATPKHLAATMISACILETVYGMDFSLPGYLACSILLWIGIFWASSTDKMRRDTWGDQSGVDLSKERRRSSVVGALPTYMQGPLEHVLADSKSRRIALFLLINMAFMVVEFTFGFLSNSLGLISDACHMLFDCAALAIGLYASYITRLQANSTYTYGYGRYEVLSGYVNAVFLVFVATLIVLESIERMLDPPNISTENILIVSVGGLLVNVLGLVFFHEAHAHAHGGSCSHSSHSHSHDKVEHDHGAHSHSHGTSCGHDHHEKPQPRDSIKDRSQPPRHGHQEHSEDSYDIDRRSSHGGNHLHHKHSGGEKHHKHSGGDEHQHQHEDHSGCKHEHGHDHHNHQHDNHHEHHHHEDHSRKEECGHAHSCGHGEDGQSHEGHHHQKHEHSEKHEHSHGSGHGHGHGHGQGSEHDCGHGHEHDGHEHGHPHSQGHDHAHGHERDHGHGHEGCGHNHHGHEHGHDKEHGHEHHHHKDGECHDHEGHKEVGPHIHTEDLGLGNAHMDHNMHGIFLHVLADTLGSVGVVISTLLIKYKGWLLTDPACSIFISVLIVSSVVPLLKNVAELVLQRVPRAAEAAIAQALEQVVHLDGVLGHQKPHFWSFTPKMVIGSLHVQVHAAADKQHVRRKVTRLFRSMGISHMTVQVEDDSFHSHGHLDEIASFVDSMTGRLDSLGSFM